MVKYTCEKCAKTFTKKYDYTNHMNKKNDCSKTTELNAVIEKKVEEKVKNTLKSLEIDKELILPEDQIERDIILQKYFKIIHDILWSRSGFEPSKAMEHLTFFFAYRLIELQADSLGLPQECRWSYLVSQKDENDMFEVMKKGYLAFQKNKITKPFFKKPEIEKVDIVYDIIKHIHRIPEKAIRDTDTLGNIFEYMQSWGTSTMGSEGQYFTNRKICRLAFKLAYKIKGELRRKDGTLCTFADWFCGTGGFPAEYVRGVNQHLQEVNWKNDHKSIYCQDKSINSCMTTLLNLLIMTGIPFDNNKIRQGDSFADPITLGNNAPFKNVEIDYGFINPPYAGSEFVYLKQIKDADGHKIKQYHVNKEIQSIGIEDNNKVSAGVQLAMATMADKGVFCIVAWEQFFFSNLKKSIELRKKLAEEYKIHYIVDITSGAFLNTGTKTSMIIFQKGVGSTDTIQFIDINEKVLAEATLDDLRKKAYLLNYKQYLPQDITEVEGFEMVKLGDIAKIEYGTRITQTKDAGSLYPAYGGGGLMTYKTDKFNRDGITYKVSRDGMSPHNCVMKIIGKYFCNDTAITIHTKDASRVIDGYIGEWLLLQKSIVYSKCSRGTAQLHIDLDALLSLQIPIPSLETQKQIVEAIDGWTQLAHQEEHNLKLLEKQVMFEVKEMGKGKPRAKLGDICEFKRGKALAKKDFVEGEYPVIGGGTKPVGTHNEYNMEEYTPLISQSGTAGHISRYSSKVWASDCFSITSEKINKDFLYYSLLHIQDDICFLKTGTAQPHIYPSSIEGLTIPLVTMVEQQRLQSDFDEIKHKHKKIAYYNEKAQEAIQHYIPK